MSTTWLIESALAAVAKQATAAAPAPKPAAPAAEAVDVPIDDASEAAGAAHELTASLEAELQGMQRQNPFQVLGVGYEAQDGDVRNAFTELSKKYHPDRFARLESERVRKLAAELFVCVRDAYKKIGDGTARAAVVASLRPRTVPRSAPPPLPPGVVGRGTQQAAQVPTAPAGGSKLNADDLFSDLGDVGPRAGATTAPPAVELQETAATNEAERLLQAGHYDQALAAFDSALRSTPNNRVARAGKALALGLKAVAGGDKAKAAQHFEAALEVDPLHEQATRELAALRRAMTDSRKGLLSKLLGKKE
jgi:tetratricopeptide (TPR) repeat protein